jgi:hypothetical protein
VAEKIIKKRKYGGNKTYKAFLKNPNPHSFMMKPTTPEKIEDIISKFNTSKKTGPNSVPQPIFQSIKKHIEIPLCNRFNMSFQAGQCPSFPKISSVIPVYK